MSRSLDLVWLLSIMLGGCVARYDATRGDTDTGSSETETGGETGGADECETEELSCDGECIDARTDTEHCGACFAECVEGTECVAGLCRRLCEDECEEPFEFCEGTFCECAPGLTDCAGDCVDLDTDPFHCGQCDRSCEDGQACGEGQCRDESCPGFGDACGRSCVDIEHDPLHCGACEAPCALDEACAGGECVTFNELPAEVCGECPCPAVCDPDDDSCCLSPRLGIEICVFGPECP